MSFTYLKVGETKVMNYEEFARHGIDENGKSELPGYHDSIFAVNHLVTHLLEPVEKYHITRFLKKDLILPVNKPVKLSMVKACALQINPDGFSRRTDLKGYKFTYDYENYEITMSKIVI